MPYIKTTANCPIPKEKREAIKTRLGKDAALLGKSENYLMVDFCENSPLYFKGSDAPAALVAVDLFGAAGAEDYSAMTAAVTELVSRELSIPPEQIFVKYAEYAHWGVNGRNF